MPLLPSDLTLYFQRIGFSHEPAPTLENLQLLHQLHTSTIPFENISPFLGEEVCLDVSSLQAKLLTCHRGGYCFEQNLLFLHVLNALGFEAKGMAARVRWEIPTHIIRPRSHMLVKVVLDGTAYIADVGFGGMTLTCPIRLEAGIEQSTPHEFFRLQYFDGIYTLEAKIGLTWKVLYSFDLQEQYEADYEVSNWYLSHHPESQFVNNLIVARPAFDGRHALCNNRYVFYRSDGGMEKKLLKNADEVVAFLWEKFFIQLSKPLEFKKRAETVFL